MLKTIFFTFFIFYILVLIQTSFLLYFGFQVLFFNLVLIQIIVINFLKISYQEKIISTIIGGIFLEIFSLSSLAGIFGFYLLILLFFCFFLKFISEKYVRIPFFEK